MIITIDGPVASGKSTVARLLAQRLGFYYLYTGMLYRGLAYILATEYGYDEDAMRSVRQEDINSIITDHAFEYRYVDGFAHIFFDGVAITSHLKTAQVDRWSSALSVHKIVRDAVLHYQIEVGQKYDCVVEGRDTGTTIFPDADHKFFLTATQDVRARRWQQDQKKQGTNYSLQESLQAVQERDKRDQERDIAPLVTADDAMVIDNSDLSIQETVDLLASIVAMSC